MQIDTPPAPRNDESRGSLVPQTEKEKWDELGEGVDKSEYPKHQPRENMVITHKDSSLQLSGSSTQLGVTLFALLGTFCFTLHSGFKPNDAIAPMALEGIIGCAVTYIDRRKKTQINS